MVIIRGSSVTSHKLGAENEEDLAVSLFFECALTRPNLLRRGQPAKYFYPHSISSMDGHALRAQKHTRFHDIKIHIKRPLRALIISEISIMRACRPRSDFTPRPANEELKSKSRFR